MIEFQARILRNRMPGDLEPLLLRGACGSDVDYVVLSEGFTMPARVMARQYADSGLVHGEVLIRTRAEHASWGMRVGCLGATGDIRQNKYHQLRRAICDQLYFTFNTTTADVEESWAADTGDVSPDGELMLQTGGRALVAAIMIPVYPMAEEGTG